MSEEKVDLKTVYSRIRNRFDHKYKLLNTYVFDWESDYFSVSTSGYTYEIEVKMSRGDFFADFKKEKKHRMLASFDELLIMRGHEQSEFVDKQYAIECGYIIPEKDNYRDNKTYMPVSTSIAICKARTPNRFYYACPWELIKIEEVPKYAGLLWVHDDGMSEVKAAPLIHKRKYPNLDSVLVDKFYHLSLAQDLEIYRLKNEILKIQNTYSLISDEDYVQQKLKL